MVVIEDFLNYVKAQWFWEGTQDQFGWEDIGDMSQDFNYRVLFKLIGVECCRKDYGEESL